MAASLSIVQIGGGQLRFLAKPFADRFEFFLSQWIAQDPLLLSVQADYGEPADLCSAC